MLSVECPVWTIMDDLMGNGNQVDEQPEPEPESYNFFVS